jgi:hypothetical protein
VHKQRFVRSAPASSGVSNATSSHGLAGDRLPKCPPPNCWPWCAGLKAGRIGNRAPGAGQLRAGVPLCRSDRAGNARSMRRPARGGLPPVKGAHFAATTEPKRVAELLRAMDGYEGTLTVRCALRLASLVFVRPGELSAFSRSVRTTTRRGFDQPSSTDTAIERAAAYPLKRGARRKHFRDNQFGRCAAPSPRPRLQAAGVPVPAHANRQKIREKPMRILFF